MEQKEFKVGDKVCLIGTVTDVVDGHSFPVKVKFLAGENESYTHLGFYYDSKSSVKSLHHYPDVTAMQAEIDEYRVQLEAALKSTNEEHTNIIALKDAEISTLQIEKRLLIELLTIKFRYK